MGGAIANAGNLTITNSLIEDNTGSEGGGDLERANGCPDHGKRHLSGNDRERDGTAAVCSTKAMPPCAM